MVHAVQHPLREELGARTCRNSSPKRRAGSRKKERALQAANLAPDAREKLQKEIAGLRAAIQSGEAERAKYTDAAWNALSARAKSLHEKAFTTNTGDPAYRSLASLTYQNGDAAPKRETSVPAGDVLHQFRRDVATGALPAVSWIVAPQNFSDHPSSAWFGAWYVSEVLDILTKNPEVWKKTVFILCYDENDGYFDHVPPFVAPHPSRPETGRASGGTRHVERSGRTSHGRESSLGLGYRVPLVIASPWSRGGAVSSQVFDHTSVIQFVETWLAGKGKQVKETNISDWRRVVCGDLTSAFRPYDDEKIDLPKAARPQRDRRTDSFREVSRTPTRWSGADEAGDRGRERWRGAGSRHETVVSAAV